jgi:hypothetical protein
MAIIFKQLLVECCSVVVRPLLFAITRPPAA